ncbi:NAD(P)H-hydrate dehydratase [Fodinibius halophilus]|uniref:Bifunctional NAD(P)H-hydrate repair enzyme n=1 Tax=Fodinibius halophilus TaxID=1736908 RepID=A0A6M1T2Y6_9BACT|nr:NAD(P)H-hydrate dehydratase [Fodinibius halophilus]NGP88407.1 NAD(P)H-hydrate dehydratase [Fodinibius halophilus]
MVNTNLEAPASHYLLTSELSQEIDQKTIQNIGIDGFTLMEVAGKSASQLLLDQYSELSNGLYLCGKGNNAGDALVLARYLLQNDIKASIVFISGSDDLSEDTRTNLQLLHKYDQHNRLKIYESWNDAKPLDTFDFVVDGLLGTGLNSDVRGKYAEAIQWCNHQQTPVFAMDIPTGLHADSGEIMGIALQADHTYSFGGRKQGFYLGDGPNLTGKIDYCELPFPNKYKQDCHSFLLDESWNSTEISPTGKHKYDSGVLYVIAGSEGLTGAAIMATKSAWAEGIGAIVLICPRGTLPIYEQTLPSIIKKPVGDRDDFFFKKKHIQKSLQIIGEKEGALLIGPGIGRDKSTIEFVQSILEENSKPTLIDADGLWCLSQLTEWPKPHDRNWILTPHPGELSKLTAENFDTDYQRLQIVQQISQKEGVTLLSKGMPGIIGTPEPKSYLTNYDTTPFARAGNGDVLAGKIASYLALGYSPDTSCAMGLLNGKQKLDHLLKQSQEVPEPTDFI